MGTAFSSETIRQLAARLPLPQRLEIQAVLRTLGSANVTGKACLDIGLRSPVASRVLRMVGGYWFSVLRDPGERALAQPFLGDAVVLSGVQGDLPFEDKQFDVVVLGHGSLANGDAAAAILQECHRVLKAGGLLTLTVDFDGRLKLPHLLNKTRVRHDQNGRYTERALFTLLKNGYDVIGMRYYCRFWTQLLRQWCDPAAQRYGENATHWAPARALYPLARVADALLFWTHGYLLTVCARRKGWTERGAPTLSNGRNFAACVLHGYRN